MKLTGNIGNMVGNKPWFWEDLHSLIWVKVFAPLSALSSYHFHT